MAGQAPALRSDVIVNGASFRSVAGRVAPGAVISIFGTGLAGATQAAVSIPVPQALFDVSVMASLRPSSFVSEWQINLRVNRSGFGPTTPQLKCGDLRERVELRFPLPQFHPACSR
jgi:hypothetical protein